MKRSKKPTGWDCCGPDYEKRMASGNMVGGGGDVSFCWLFDMLTCGLFQDYVYRYVVAYDDGHFDESCPHLWIKAAKTAT